MTYQFEIRDCYMYITDPFIYYDVSVHLISIHGASIEKVLTRNSKAASPWGTAATSPFRDATSVIWEMPRASSWRTWNR